MVLAQLINTISPSESIEDNPALDDRSRSDNFLHEFDGTFVAAFGWIAASRPLLSCILSPIVSGYVLHWRVSFKEVYYDCKV